MRPGRSSDTRPYSAKNTQTDTTLTENISLILRVTRTFDQWGNKTQEFDYGRTDLPGDQRLTNWAYAPNTSAFITSLPRAETVWPTTGATEALKATYFYYDGSITNTDAPAKGDVTIRHHYVTYDTSQPIQRVNEYFTYDSYGNLLTVVDGAGNKTETLYDTTYHLYPNIVRNPRYFANGGQPADTRHFTTTAHNTVCGQPAEHTDLNGVEHTYAYDPFCRLYDYRNTATGHYKLFRFYNEGNPAAQYVSVLQPVPNGAGSVVLSRFYDGLGRIWRETSSADVATDPSRITDTVYDRRGNVAERTHPYFSGGPPQVTRTTYDWSDRPVDDHPSGRFLAPDDLRLYEYRDPQHGKRAARLCPPV